MTKGQFYFFSAGIAGEKNREEKKGMTPSGLNRQTVWLLIIFIVGPAIVFLAGLVILRLKGYYIGPRKFKERKTQKITKGQVILGLSCIIFPVGGLGGSYVFGCSLKGCLFWMLAGILIATIVLVFWDWRMAKKEKLDLYCR